MTELLSQSHFRCSAPKLGIDLAMTLPRGLDALLARMLSGWVLTETPAHTTSADIIVTSDDSFRLASMHYESGNTYDDIVSILNEVLVAIAYACRTGVADSGLIHAAGFGDDTSAQVVFGARKAGKSVMTARKAASGHRIFADDLLLWRDKQHDFVGLGLAPRLRRPVLPDILDALGSDTFIVGTYTCYLIADRINLAPAGSVLRPDHVLELQPDQSLRKIRLWHVNKEIAAHRIP